MPTVRAILCPGQSQAGFFLNNGTIYKEAALSAVTQSGVGELKAEVERRLPGWTFVNHGRIANTTGTVIAGDTGAGGSSFVNDTIDPTVSPADDTPLTGNTDSRLIAGTGQVYMNSIDSIIATNNASTDAWIVYQHFQTWDIAEGALSDSRLIQCRAMKLWWTLVRSKLLATGKPFRMYIVTPGFSERGNQNWQMGLLHESHNHMTQNGYRSVAPEIAAYDRIEDLYLLVGANGTVSFDDARQADNVFVSATDFAHPTLGSNIRLARQMALGIARWTATSVTQEYNDVPYVEAFEYQPGNPFGVRAKVKITPGNRLVWVPKPADQVSITPEAGGVPVSDLPGGNSHVLVHAHRFYTSGTPYQGLNPHRIPVVSIGVDNTYSSVGYGYLNMELAAKPTYGTCFSIQPSQKYTMYTYQTSTSIAPGNKLLMGLREEAGTSAYSITASCEDVLISGRTWLPVLPVTSFRIETGIFPTVSAVVSTSDESYGILTDGMNYFITTESGIQIWRD